MAVQHLPRDLVWPTGGLKERALARTLNINIENALGP